MTMNSNARNLGLATLLGACLAAGTAFAQPAPQGSPDGKGPRGDGPRMSPEQRQEMHDKYEKATPEERQKMREAMHKAREARGDGKGPQGDHPRMTPEQRREMREKMEKASPEERQKMRDEMRAKRQKDREARGGEGKGPHGDRPRMTPQQHREMREKMQNATPEERKKMREEMHSRMHKEGEARGPRDGKGPNAAPAKPGEPEHKH